MSRKRQGLCLASFTKKTVSWYPTDCGRPRRRASFTETVPVRRYLRCVSKKILRGIFVSSHICSMVSVPHSANCIAVIRLSSLCFRYFRGCWATMVGRIEKMEEYSESLGLWTTMTAMATSRMCGLSHATSPNKVFFFIL